MTRIADPISRTGEWGFVFLDCAGVQKQTQATTSGTKYLIPEQATLSAIHDCPTAHTQESKHGLALDSRQCRKAVWLEGMCEYTE